MSISIFKTNYENYFKDMFESIPDYRKIVMILFSFQNDDDLLKDCGFLKNDINKLRNEFKKTLVEQNEEYLAFIKDQEESNIEIFFRK